MKSIACSCLAPALQKRPPSASDPNDSFRIFKSQRCLARSSKQQTPRMTGGRGVCTKYSLPGKVLAGPSGMAPRKLRYSHGLRSDGQVLLDRILSASCCFR